MIHGFVPTLRVVPAGGKYEWMAPYSTVRVDGTDKVSDFKVRPGMTGVLESSVWG